MFVFINIKTLVDKIRNANGVLVGAAAGMSAACCYNFFIRTMRSSKNIWANSAENTVTPERSTDFTTVIHLGKPLGLPCLHRLSGI